MFDFDEYVTEMEERRTQEKRARCNEAIAQSLRERTYEESVRALYAGLTFIGGISDVLLPVATERTLQSAF